MAASGGGGAPNKLAYLRAMFEKKDESVSTSPPEHRGRSPGVESAASSSRNGTSPRPFSTVRTSFIAVGGSGGVGVVRADSSNSDNMNRRSAFSMDMETNPKEMTDAKDTLDVEMDARSKSAAISETVPENALETPAHTPLLEADGKKLEVKSNGKPMNGKPVSEKTSPTKTAPVLALKSKPTNGTSVKSPGPASAKTPTSAKPSAQQSTSSTRTKPSPAAILTSKTTTIPKASPKQSSKPAKSTMPKTPTSPRAPVQKKSPTKATVSTAAPKLAKTPEKKPSRSSLTSSASHKSPVASRKTKEDSPSAFVKPKPKSPTKPVRLPVSLTAPTASSRSKTSGATGPPPARSQSRATVAPTPTIGLKRSQSTATKRSAIGPPPVKKESTRTSIGGAARPQSAQANSQTPNEGFMARMMRPTASSQSKANEKTPATPPKKPQPVKRPARHSTSRPSTRDSTSVQKPFDDSPKAPKVQKPSSIHPASPEKPKTVTAPAEIVEVAPGMERIDAIVEPVPETAAEAVVAELLTEPVPTEEDAKIGEKTECAPITNEAVAPSESTPISEEPAAMTKVEAEELSQETAPEASPKAEATLVEPAPTTPEEEKTEIGKEVATAPTEVITEPSKTLENTVEQIADAGDVPVTETKVEPTAEDKEEAS